MIDDKIQDYIVVHRSFSHHFASFHCEIAYSNMQPEDSDAIKCKNLWHSTKRGCYCFLPLARC